MGQSVTLGGPIEGPLVVPLQKLGFLPERARSGPLAMDRRQPLAPHMIAVPGYFSRSDQIERRKA
jgi:hypothetical protein